MPEKWSIAQAIQAKEKHGAGKMNIGYGPAEISYARGEPRLPVPNMDSQHVISSFHMLMDSNVDDILLLCDGKHLANLHHDEPLKEEHRALLEECTKRRGDLRVKIHELLVRSIKIEQNLIGISMFCTRYTMFEIEHRASQLRIHLKAALYSDAVLNDSQLDTYVEGFRREMALLERRVQQAEMYLGTRD
jgi:hypothetical protein